MRLKLEGIGASLQGVDGYTVVKKIIPGGAAEKEGHLKVEDKIVAVGQGENGELVDVVDMKLNDVVKLIRGKPGTVVRLEVIPMQRHRAEDRHASRGTKIELKDSEAQGKVFDAGRKADGQPYKIGVIDLPSFYMDMDGARSGDARLQEHHPRRAADPRRLQRQGRRRGGRSTSAATAAARSTRPST